MINDINVWHVIMLACSLFNFFYVLYTFLKEDGFDGFDNCLFSVIMMLFGAVTSVFGTFVIIIWEIVGFINNAPKRVIKSKIKLQTLIKEFNVMIGKEKYER